MATNATKNTTSLKKNTNSKTGVKPVSSDVSVSYDPVTGKVTNPQNSNKTITPAKPGTPSEPSVSYDPVTGKVTKGKSAVTTKPLSYEEWLDKEVRPNRSKFDLTWDDPDFRKYYQETYLKSFEPKPITPSPTTPKPPSPKVVTGTTNQVVPGEAVGKTQINVADYTGQLVIDPKIGVPKGATLSNEVPTISQKEVQKGIIQDQPKLDPKTFSKGTAQVQQTAIATGVDPREAVGYDPEQTFSSVSGQDMVGATGTLSEEAKLQNVPEINVDDTALGLNELGKALDNFAFLDPSNVDAKVTVKGQIDILQEEFKDDNGNPVIPSWAQGVARNVSKIAAFTGLSGTAATAAMAQALLESSIQIAEKDATFFQTLTLQNLSNEQQSILQKASVLANLELKNADSRTAAAIQASKNFLAMDLQNLDNEQQARLLNTQNRVQSILEDAKAVNTSRLFLAESQNEKDKFYDNLNAQISQFNANQKNAMSQFNAGQKNAMAQFNANLENQRDLFYREMAYNIDVANAKWRQTVSLTNTQMQFEAAAFDAKNLLNISQEALNQIWDRSDALLDYIWKSAENKEDRDAAFVVAKLQADTSLSLEKAREKASEKAGWGQIIGTIAGTLFSKLF